MIIIWDKNWTLKVDGESLVYRAVFKCKWCTLILCTLSLLANSSSLLLISIWWTRCMEGGHRRNYHHLICRARHRLADSVLTVFVPPVHRVPPTSISSTLWKMAWARHSRTCLWWALCISLCLYSFSGTIRPLRVIWWQQQCQQGSVYREFSGWFSNWGHQQLILCVETLHKNSLSASLWVTRSYANFNVKEQF